MKSSKRILTILMAFLMIFGSLAMMFIFTSCGEDDDEIRVDIDAINFLITGTDGAFELIAGEFCINTRSIAVPENADRQNVVNAAVIQRNAQIYDELGVEVVMRHRTTVGGLNEYITPLFATGFTDYHVLSGHQWFSIGKVLGTGAGRFINFNGLTESENSLQLDQPWWDDQRIEALTWNDVSWYITGHLSQSWIAAVYVSIVNRRMWEEHSSTIADLTGGLSCIYDIVRAGLWTIELWIEITNAIFTSVTGADTPRRGDTVGFLSEGPSNFDGYALSVGSNVPFTIFEGGRPQVGLQSPRAVEFADLINELFFDSRSLVPNPGGTEEMFDIFREGTALMMISMLQNIEIRLVDEGFEDGIHIAPLPKMNAEQANYYSLVHELIGLFVIPVDHFGIISDLTRVLDRMAELSYRIVYPAFFQTAIQRMIIGGDYTNVSEMLRIARDGIYTCFVVVWASEISFNIVGLFRGGSPNYVANVRGQIGSWNRTVATLIGRLDDAVVETNLQMARARQEFNR